MISDPEKRWYLHKMIPVLFISWTLITLYLTLSPAQYIADVHLFDFDKLGHFAMFGGWTGLVGLYIMIYKGRYNVNLLPLVIIGIVFGAFIEFLQWALPIYRSPSFMDMVANSLGCIAAWGVLRFIQRRIKLLNSKKGISVK